MKIRSVFTAIICVCHFAGLNGFALTEYLRSLKYDKSIRPFFNEKPVNVTLQMTIHSIGPIDEAKFTFQFGFYLRQWWIDPRLIINTTSHIHATSLEHLIWIPDTAILDSNEVKTFSHSVRTAIDPVNGEVYLSRRFKAVTLCDMDLKYYPMDKQKCKIAFENYAFTTHDIELFWHTTPIIQKDEHMGLDGYKLKEITTEVKRDQDLIGSDQQNFKYLIFNVLVERTLMFHIYRAYIPSMLLLTFAFGTFWVPDAAVPARMGMIVTSFLANIFILQGVTEKIVKVSYTTPLQLFLLVNVLVIVLSLMEYLLVLQLKARSDSKKKKREAREVSSKHENGNGHIDAHKRLVVYNSNPKNKNKDFEELILSNKIEKKEQKEYSYHLLIDLICRVLFPTLYFIFCAVYFAYYLK